MEINISICPVCQAGSHNSMVPNKLNYYVHCNRCGQFEITMQAMIPVQDDQIFRDNFWKISYWIRNRQKVEEKVFIDTNILRNILEKISLPGPREQADNLIRWIGDEVETPEQEKRIEYVNLTSIIGTKDIKGVKYIIEHLLKDNLFNRGDQGDKVILGLTFKGWDKYNKLKIKGSYTKKVFMAMKYGEETLEKLYNEYLKNTVSETGFDLFKLDEVLTAGLIDNQLRVQIRNARFVLADLTHDNYGAYWEAGYAEGLGKPVIYLCEKKKFKKLQTHFDTNHHTTIIWDLENIKDSLSKLKATIRETLPLEAKMTDDKNELNSWGRIGKN